jgi:glycosyltransferase involved in cell wall biosynthesis
MKLIPESIDFELVIKTQSTEISNIIDPRITIDKTEPVDEKELYRNFDAMIMPRRYGGACLPMNESLASGIPVIMTNIDPNNKVLPAEWLVPAKHNGSFMTRTKIDLYNADKNALADKIIEFATEPEENLIARKILAREIACNEYSSEVIKEKWALLMSKIGL